MLLPSAATANVCRFPVRPMRLWAAPEPTRSVRHAAARRPGWRWCPEPAIGRVGAWASSRILGSYFKMLIARAITNAPMTSDTTASIIISSLAHRLIAETSVGLNAVAVQKASDR